MLVVVTYDGCVTTTSIAYDIKTLILGLIFKDKRLFAKLRINVRFKQVAKNIVPKDTGCEAGMGG